MTSLALIIFGVMGIAAGQRQTFSDGFWFGLGVVFLVLAAACHIAIIEDHIILH